MAPVAQLAPDVQWMESYVADNKTFCVYLATDEAAIRKIIADNTEAFNRHDPAALSSHLTEDADHIGVTGAWMLTPDSSNE